MNPPQPEIIETLENRLNTVFEYHEQRKFDIAESLYLKLIADYPFIWQLHFNYGLLLFELGRYSDALTAYEKGLDIEQSDGDLWYNIALCLKNMGRYEQAIKSYRKTLSLIPGDPECLYNLAGCYRVMGDDEKAIDWYEQTLRVNATHLSALNNLAYLHHKNDEPGRASKLYRNILELDPDHELAEHMLASIEGRNIKNAPEGYIRDVFDQFSDHYETSLVDKLKYKLPTVLLQFMQQSCSSASFGRVLELGCGTGLTGEVLRPYCRSLTGIDISEKMVAIADEKSIYDTLHIAEILTFLTSRETAGYDCILAADVLPYIGDLKQLFVSVADVLADEGVFFFSVEALQDERSMFQLQSSGRFAHTDAYIKAVANETGWKISASDSTDLRREKDCWITGHIFGLIKNPV